MALSKSEMLKILLMPGLRVIYDQSSARAAYYDCRHYLKSYLSIEEMAIYLKQKIFK
jgi:hypothetical protein